jgi:hypothetical protein
MAEVEAQIQQLQSEIDTFITAVDQEGREYRILMNEQDHLLVPVDDDGEEEEEVSDSGGAYANVSQSGSSDGLLLTERHSGSSAADAAAQQAEVARVVRSPSVPEPKTNTVGSVGFAPGCLETRTRPGHPLTTMSKRDGSTRKASRVVRSPATRRKPAIHVKQVRGLLPEEEERLSQLLRLPSDGKGIETSFEVPFFFSAKESARIAELDQRMEQLRHVREAAQCHVSSPESRAEAVRAVERQVVQSVAAEASLSPRVLGNRYMRQANDAALFQRQMEAVNAQLLQVHRALERLTLSPSMDLPHDVRELRPAWACKESYLSSEDEVQEMLRLAAEEKRLAEQEHSWPSSSSVVPSKTPFMTRMNDVCGRAVALVEDAEKHPLTLTECIFTSVDASDWSEREEEEELAVPPELSVFTSEIER